MEVVIPLWVYPILFWTIVWKAVASWKAARRGHLVWFVVFFVINTIGILPIIYLIWFRGVSPKKKKKKLKKVDKKFKGNFPKLFK